MTYPGSDDYLSNVTDDYRPPHMRHAMRVLDMMKNEPPPVTYHEPSLNPMAQRDPLAEIASLVRRLTYGQMVELSTGVGVPADVIHDWAQKMP